MYLDPGGQLWLDAWIPRDDPLWVLDVSAAAEWVGRVVDGRTGPARAARSRRAHRSLRAGRARSTWCASPAGVPARCSGAAARWSASRSGGLARARCSPRAPISIGTRSRCPHFSTYGRARPRRARSGTDAGGGRTRRAGAARGGRGDACRAELLGSFAALGVTPRHGGDAPACRSACSPQPLPQPQRHSAPSLVLFLPLIPPLCVRSRLVPAPGGVRFAPGTVPRARQSPPPGAARPGRWPWREGVAVGLPGVQVVVRWREMA